MRSFEIVPTGPYSLKESAEFLWGFTPAASPAPEDRHLHLCFVVDGSDRIAGVCLREDRDRVIGDVYGDADLDAARTQSARILSIDIDGTAYPEVGTRDPAIGRLQAKHPGLRPVLFVSPYDAAGWAILSQRVQMPHAARIKANLSKAHGPSVDIHGDVRFAFPTPDALARVKSFPGIVDKKIPWLHAIAAAAKKGAFDAARLRAMPVDFALASLKEIPGIGDFGSQHVLLRGAGTPDVMPSAEPRVRAAMKRAYGLKEEPSVARSMGIAEAWRPFRTWVAVLLRVAA